MKHNGVQAAKDFLALLEKDRELRDEVRKLTGVIDIGAKRNLKFTNQDLEKALQDRWGTPPKRCPEPTEPVDIYTCCCI